MFCNALGEALTSQDAQSMCILWKVQAAPIQVNITTSPCHDGLFEEVRASLLSEAAPSLPSFCYSVAKFRWSGSVRVLIVARAWILLTLPLPQNFPQLPRAVVALCLLLCAASPLTAPQVG